MSRPRFQKGSIRQQDRAWYVRFYDYSVPDKNGKFPSQRTVFLAPVCLEYKTETQVKPLAAKIMAEVNSRLSTRNDVSMSLGEFIEQKYLPHLEQRRSMTGELHLKASTIKGYRDIWKFRVKRTAIADIRVRDITTANVHEFFMELDQNLSHQSHLRVKAFLSGTFNYAKRVGAISGVNPADGTKVGGKKKTFQAKGYTLDEIAMMLEKLPEPARTVCAVAAFTGLRASELRGLRWRDYDGEKLTVNQRIWGTDVDEPKTEASKGGVPVIDALKRILEDYKKEFPPNGSEYIFRGERDGFALSLDNLSRRTIALILGDVWFGWHGFRRGLATNLFRLGVDPKVIQQILRHSNIRITQDFYILHDPEQAKKDMEKFGKIFDAHRIARKSGP